MIQIFVNNLNKSKFYSERNYEEIEVRECFLLFGAEILSPSVLSKNLKIEIYSTIILPVVLYECETWSLTLKEERSLRLFENRILKKTFGPKVGEVKWEWRKLHIGLLNDLYSSLNIMRVVKSRI